MLPLSMLFLICALFGGVFGFGAGAAPAWIIARGLFFICFGLAVTLMIYGLRVRPVRLATIDNKVGAYF